MNQGHVEVDFLCDELTCIDSIYVVERITIVNKSCNSSIVVSCKIITGPTGAQAPDLLPLLTPLLKSKVFWKEPLKLNTQYSIQDPNILVPGS